MIRHILRREVSPVGAWSKDTYPEPFDLRWAAWAASIETLQIDIQNLIFTGQFLHLVDEFLLFY